MMKILLALLLGGLIGASIQRFEGFFVGAAVGYLLLELHRLKNKVVELEKMVEHRPVQGAETVKPDGAPARTAPEMALDGVEPGFEPAGVREPIPPESAMEAEPFSTGPEVLHSASTAPREVTSPPAPHGPSTTGRWTSVRRHVEQWLAGGNLLVKIGVLVLFVGVAFLVRYAAEREILPIEVRLAGVALGAVVLLVIGWRLRNRRRAYALVLQGGAVAVLYLTIFGAMRLYGLIPPSLAFLLLAGVAVLSGALAVLQDARALASIGTAGGFAAPILASTGQGSHVMLFSYYAVLNLSVVGTAWFKAWRELNLVGFLFTFTIGAAWGVLVFRPHQFSTTEPFLILFFLLYVGAAILFALRQPPNLKGYVDGPIVFGLPIIAFALQSGLVKPYPFGLAWSAFALAGFYVGVAWVIFLKAPKTLWLMAEAFLAIGVAFGTLAIPLALDNRWTAAAWAMEGAALVWIGLRQERWLPRMAGMALQLASGFSFLSNLPGTYGTWPLLNGFWLGSAVVSIAGLFTSWCVHTYREKVKTYEAIFGILLGVWGLLWWYGAGIRELDVHGPEQHRLGALLLFLSASGLMSDVLRVALRWPFMGYPAWGLIPALTLVAISLLGDRTHPFADGGWWGWMAGVACCYGILWRQEKHSAFPGWEGRLHPPCLWLSTLVLTWEMAHRVSLWVPASETWSTAILGVFPTALVLFITLQGDHISWPFSRHRKDYLIWGNLGLCAYLVIWIIATSFSSGSAAPLPYFPFLNPLDAATILALLSILLWIVHLREEFPVIADRLRIYSLAWVCPAVYGSLVFLWLNAVLARTLHHWTGLSFSSHALMRSVLFQASISILWSLTALCLMVFAAKRRLRALWMAGAGLLGVTVVKLFLVDLARSGTLGRVISFITVGILILVVGYFSPVPPRRKEEVPQ